MFEYKNKVHRGMKIEFIKGKFVFSVVWVLDFAEIINVRDQFLFFWKYGYFLQKVKKWEIFYAINRNKNRWKLVNQIHHSLCLTSKGF